MSRIIRLSVLLIAALSLALLPTTALAEGNGKGEGKGADNGKSSQKIEQSQTDDGDAEADEGDNRHPSGKDRQDDASYPQGKSKSDPDGDENGGEDKPGGSGGVDKQDQDGNNGCGNDDDFEDDNNGNCGGKEKGDKDGDEPVEGNSQAEIDLTVTCDTVTVTSSKDISHVVVTFADGEKKKFDGLSGHEWSRTFDRQVVAAKAKSGTTVTEQSASGPCGQGGQQPTDEGNGPHANMTLSVTCDTVTVTSSKDISNVRVFFADGGMDEIQVNQPEWSKTFDREILSARAKSALTVIEAEAEGPCRQDGVQGDDGSVETLKVEAACHLVTIESSAALTKVLVTYGDDSVQTFEQDLGLGDDATLTMAFEKALASVKVFTANDAALGTVDGTCDEDGGAVLPDDADVVVDADGVLTAGPTGDTAADEAGVLSAGAENAPADEEAGVLGAAFDADEEAAAAPASSLARTGLTIAGFLLVAGLLTAAGFGLRRLARDR